MAKVQPISGFPEWLPQDKRLEDDVILKIKKVYASYGFLPIETPAVELRSTLESKGEIMNEVYLLRRIHAEAGEESDLALHYDLTVPFARYVAQHFNDLAFPFRRYQLQKVWRGERPQRGRMREFYQFDIDVIAVDELPLSLDAEVLSALDEAFSVLALGPHRIRLNHRKLFFGFYESLGITGDVARTVLATVDKLDKIGAEKVQNVLERDVGLSSESARRVLQFAGIRAKAQELVAAFEDLACNHEMFREGVSELQQILSYLPDARRGAIEIDCSVARGLEYYTGTVFEFGLVDHPEYPTVASGGRYDDLASQFINKKLPGVGGSIGLTRLMNLIIEKKLLTSENSSPVDVLVAVYDDAQRGRCNEIAQSLRSEGARVEVFFKAPKLGKQIEYAAKRRIPRVLFCSPDDGSIEIKDVETGQQERIAQLAEWWRARKLK